MSPTGVGILGLRTTACHSVRFGDTDLNDDDQTTERMCSYVT